MSRARDNPFATSRVLEIRYQFRTGNDEGWRTLLSRLESLRYRAAIVGPHGTGKTTLLEDLGLRLIKRGFRIHSVFLNRQSRVYPIDFIHRTRGDLSSRDVILLDGCEQLGLHNWWRFRWQTRSAGGLIVTTHRAGRLPVLWRCQTNPELLSDLIGRLLGHSSVADRIEAQSAVRLFDFEGDDARRLFESHRGNLRDALRELYDRAAQAREDRTLS